MTDAPSWSELSDLLDQLAYLASAHADIARSTLDLSGHPEARDQLRQALETLAVGQEGLAKALRHAASLSGAIVAKQDTETN